MKVKDLNGVEVDVQEGYLNAVTIDPKDIEYIEEVLNPEMREILTYLIISGIFTLDHLKSKLN